MNRYLIPFLLSCLFSLAKPLHAIENDLYKYQSFNSTTTVSTIPVKLHSITITGTAAVAFFVYDSTSSSVLTPVISSFTASTAAGTYLFDVQTQNGLQINEAASGPNITVNYR